MDKSFYTSNVHNNNQKIDFSQHISSLRSDLQAEKDSNTYKKRQILLSTILPKYTPGDVQGLRERDFVNSVEKILYSF